MITLLLALAIQAAWPSDRPDNGWTWRGVTTNQETLLLTKPGPRKGMIWTRQESRVADPRFGTLSSVTLVEADCEGRRSRTVQATDWSGPNLTGEPTSYEGVGWRYPTPNSLAEAVLDYACE